MDNRTIERGATLAVLVLAFAAPAVAAAQTDPLSQLEAMSFINRSQVMTVKVDPSSPVASQALPPDRLKAALDHVKVVDSNGTTLLLGQYLSNQGIDPSSIVGVLIRNRVVFIIHK